MFTHIQYTESMQKHGLVQTAMITHVFADR